MGEGDIEQSGGMGRGPADHPVGAPLRFGDLRHTVVGEDLEGELLVLRRYQSPDLGLELVGVHLVHALVLGRNDDVDPVRLVADVLVDPSELHLELLGSEADGTEDADAPGVGDRGHDVAAVGEGEDGELDAQLAADFGVHRWGSFGGSGPVAEGDRPVVPPGR